MMFMLEFLNMIYLQAGVFESREDAQKWVDTYDTDRSNLYTIFPIPLNDTNSLSFKVEAPQSRYTCAR